jgi:serine protease AprX
MKARVLRRAALAAALLVTLGALGGGGAAQATGGGPVRAVQIDPSLHEQLRGNPSGVDAVVTTWNRTGLDAVASLGVTGTRLRTLPMLLTTSLTAAQLDALTASPAVQSVWANTRHRVLMEDSTWITRARYAWAESNGSGGLPGQGITGKGVEIAEIDTGVDAGHEDADNVIEFCESAGAGTGSRNLVACTPFRPAAGNLPYASGTNPRVDCAAPGTCDEGSGQGHGSHVAGTIAGTGHASGGQQARHSTIGMAPHAKLRVYSANVGPALLNFQILASYDDLTWKKENGFSEVVAVSNSWGGGDGFAYASGDPVNVAVKRAFNAGILSVFAAGNSGPEHNTLSRQCVNPFVVCVAASTKPDSLVMFSSRGRPSQPWDTNRDGKVDETDVQPDNHDRRLGQALDLGLYRPTLAAPGANINSIQANAAHPDCRENLLISTPDVPGKDCYDFFNGTSMSTPHVSGAVALIVQAYRRGHDGDTPTPNQITDILERSANVTKLPGWEAEEQGAGRLDALEAVKFARSYPNGLRRPNFGHPTPPYVQGDFPIGPDGEDSNDYVEAGCTSPGSWSYGDLEGPAPSPVVPSVGFGQHFIDVPAKTERLRVTVRWGQYHPATNLYVRMWRPGVNPDADTNPAGPTKTFPDQESLNLLGDLGPFLGPERLMEIRAPEESNIAEGGAPPAIPSGRWVIRVYHRAGADPPQAPMCAGSENPKRLGPAYRYDLHVELSTVTHAPTVSITSPAENAQTTGRWVEVRGRAGYPPPDNPASGNAGRSWEGITNWEVPGSARTTSGEHSDPDPSNPRPVLSFQGNLNDPDPAEANCVGDGKLDNVGPCNGPKLLTSSTLSTNSTGAASWKGDPSEWAATGTSPGGDRLPIDPNWVWCVSATPTVDCPIRDPGAPTPPVSISGAMTVEWWASCAPLCIGGGPDWVLRLWVDGILITEQQVAVGPNLPLVPDRLRATIEVPPATANERITLHVEPVFLIDQFLPFHIYYDHTGACSPAASSGPCDSLVRMPVGSSGGSGGGTGPAPANIRVTDLPANSPYPAATQSPALRVAWDPVPGATRYDVYRSTDPTLLGTRVFSGAGSACTSPEAPSPEPADAPPGHDRSGLCFTNTSGLNFLTTYYYRVFSFDSSGARSVLSRAAYAAPTRYDRQVKLKVDRLYGPQHWEHALQPSSPFPSDTTNAGTDWRYLWDTLELTPGPHNLFARSFTQGIGSKKDRQVLRDDGNNPPPDPGEGCPDDDDGDGDDDDEDGDDDDNGDDEDDDCEDDEDHEEDEDD